jgi:hypothetical protein
MHLGLAGMPTDEDWPEVAELGVTWLKFGAAPAQTAIDGVLRQAEVCREHDLRPVIDLRCDGNILKGLYAATQDLLPEERDLRKRGRARWAEAVSRMGEMTYALVNACRGVCEDWEVWGEFNCPVVVRGTFASHDYTLHLASQYDAIKQANAKARVWTGGGGIRASTDWLEHMLVPPQAQAARHFRVEQQDEGTGTWTPMDDDYLTAEEAERAFLPDGTFRVAEVASPPLHTWFPEGVGEDFDVLNWHHYGHTAQPEWEDYGLEAQLAAFDRNFARARALLRDHGRNQPFASTEWGLPMVADEDLFLPDGSIAQGGLYFGMFNSEAQEATVYGIPDSRSAEWYDACFANFERHGFRVLCVHELRDDPQDFMYKHGFWGKRCGLIDAQGRKRPAYYTVQQWAQRARASNTDPWEGVLIGDGQ